MGRNIKRYLVKLLWCGEIVYIAWSDWILWTIWRNMSSAFWQGFALPFLVIFTLATVLISLTFAVFGIKEE